MTELGLILGINIAGLAFSLGLYRWIGARDSGSAAAKRLSLAVARASGALMTRILRSSLLAVLASAGCLFLLHGYFAGQGAALSGTFVAFWTSIAILVGATSATGASYVAARFTERASIRTTAALRVSSDRALAISVRAGGAVGVLAEALAAAGTLFFYVLLLAAHGVFALPEEQAAPVAFRLSLLIPGHTLGAALAALILQQTGATYRVASEVGATLAGERDAALEHHDPRNPAVVGSVVGAHVGLSGVRSLDLFASASVANATILVAGASTWLENPAELSTILALCLLSFAIRSFGLVACCFGVMVVRTDDGHHPASAIVRGHAATLIVSLAGLAGACIWLLSQSIRLSFFLAGALGVLTVASIAYALARGALRSAAAGREAQEALRHGENLATAFGLSAGLQATLVPVLALGLASVTAFQLGQSTQIVNGGLFATLTMLSSVLASGPYLLAVFALGPISDGSRAVLRIAGTPSDGETERRASRLEEAGHFGGSAAQPYMIVASCLAALSAALSLVLALSSRGTSAVADLGQPVVLWCGALGAGLVLLSAGRATGAAVRGARSVASEVERQLRGFQRQGGVAQVPHDFTPSYKASIDVTLKSATERVPVSLALGLALPVLLGVSLKSRLLSEEPVLAAAGLAAFVAIATLTALLFGLSLDASHTTLQNARRLNPPRGASSSFAASLGVGGVAEILGHSATPALGLVVKVTAVTALLMVPLLT